MMNYYGVVRTNYFHVKDEEKFRALMAKVICDDGRLELWDDETDAAGDRLFGFGVYGSIGGIPDENDKYDDDAYDRFIDELTERKTALCRRLRAGRHIEGLRAHRPSRSGTQAGTAHARQQSVEYEDNVLLTYKGANPCQLRCIS